MARRIKMTFERGGVIYADLQENAPKAAEQFCKALPIVYPMVQEECGKRRGTCVIQE